MSMKVKSRFAERRRTRSNKSECSAVKIVADHDVRAAVQRVERGCHRRQTGGECPAARAAFQIGDATFVGEPRRIDRARVIVAFVLAGTFLDVGRRGVNRRHDRAGRRIRFLAGVNRAGGKLLLFSHSLGKSLRKIRDRSALILSACAVANRKANRSA